MRRRAVALGAVTAALLACLAASPAPAVSAPAQPSRAQVGAEWHRLHPALCHTVGDHERLS